MAMHVSKSSNPPGLIFHLTDDVTFEEIQSIANTVAMEDQLAYVYTDFTEASSISITVSDLHQVAVNERSVPDTQGLEKLAIVGLKDEYVWIKENYLLITETWMGRHINLETRFFENPAEAAPWLGISTDIIDADHQ